MFRTRGFIFRKTVVYTVLVWYVFHAARCWWRSWLRHCATSRKVAGLIHDGVIGIFRWHSPSGRTMTLGLTQPLTEMSARNISWYSVMVWYVFHAARGSAVGWDTALQAGRSRVQFPMVSLEFFIDIILPAALWPWGWLSLSQNRESTSWNPQGLSRPVMGLIYLYLLHGSV